MLSLVFLYSVIRNRVFRTALVLLATASIAYGLAYGVVLVNSLMKGTAPHGNASRTHRTTVERRTSASH